MIFCMFVSIINDGCVNYFCRYLIAVDDLWDVPMWDIINCIFQENGKRSRVIVTTRHLDVAISSSGDNGILR